MTPDQIIAPSRPSPALPFEGFHDPIVSDIPALVVWGSNDTQTAMKDAKLAAETLTRSQVVGFRETGHGAIVFSKCARDVGLAFIERSEEPVNAACTEALKPDFVLPPESRPPPGKRVARPLAVSAEIGAREAAQMREAAVQSDGRDLVARVPRQKALARPFEADAHEPGPRSAPQHVLEGYLQAAHAELDLLRKVDDGDRFVRARAHDLDRAPHTERVRGGFAEAVHPAHGLGQPVGDEVAREHVDRPRCPL
jgi:hypothetical protein